jgi:uncharacterized protein YbjT (DUF2867 family)
MGWDLDKPFCEDLPTKPDKSIGKILVTGASGYVGGRLVKELMARGYNVRAMVRSDPSIYYERWPGVEVVKTDALNYEDLLLALDGVDVIFYLIHSLLLGKQEFATVDTNVAINFRNAAEKKNVKRIIYLGALGDKKKALSNHLNSRLQVAIELFKGTVPVTILRAAIIIGSGSASFEILENLVRKVPIFIFPTWARTKCQPVSIRDVIKYLVGSMEIPETAGQLFDIGGKDQLSYKEMIMRFASIINKKKLTCNLPVSNYGFYAYIANMLTPVPLQIIRTLMESCPNEVICLENDIKDYLDFDRLSFTEAVVFALDREMQDKISTRWTDAYPPASALAIKLSELPEPKFMSSYSLYTAKDASSLFESICTIGGKQGWFNTNWMWRLRGFIDKLLLGVGSHRGRRSNSTLRVNDVIDFWRVEALQTNKKLLLRAEMILPGKAWLEFNINQLQEKQQLKVTAYFHPKGYRGIIYWYTFLPFHFFIFNDLIKQIERMS